MRSFAIEGKVNVFPGGAPWHWVGVPEDIADEIFKAVPAGPWRFAPVTAKVGKTEWRTSLLPLGQGKYFIALKAQVRKAEGIFAGDTVVLQIRP